MAKPGSNNTLITPTDETNENAKQARTGSSKNDNLTFEQAVLKTLQNIEKSLEESKKSTQDAVTGLKDLESLQRDTQNRLDKEVNQLKEAGAFKTKREEESYRSRREKEELDNTQKVLLKTFVENQNKWYKEAYKSRDERNKERYAYNKHILDNAVDEYGHVYTAEEKHQAASENLQISLGESLKTSLQKTLRQAFSEVNSAVNSTITKYAEYQASINTRLQGSSKNFQSAERLLTRAVGTQPYFKTESLLDNLQALVGQGINFNVEQRAFLETISEKIATTFDVANSSLLRIVKLQQADSSAARLGMEAALTSYFNKMYEDTSYLNQEFDTVQGALVEASALMTTKSSVAFEYQVQKWLGSLSSLGMSDTTVTAIGQALGYLGSGNISALGGSNIQNLLAVASNRAGLSYGSLLSGGLNETTTNILLRSMVEYLKEIAVSTNNVAKSEIAQQFGVTISDLTAALNLSTNTLDNLSRQSMSYSQDITELGRQLGQVAGRTSTAGMVDTMYSNVFFSLASNIAKNPILAATWRITDLIQQHTGGINIPTQEIGTLIYGAKTGNITGTAGNGALEGVVTSMDPVYKTSWVDMETTAENLIKLGIIGAGTLGSIGEIVGGLSNTLIPSLMLSTMGITSSIFSRGGLETISRGLGLESLVKGFGTSSVTYIGTTGSSIYDATMAGVQDLKDAASQLKIEGNTESINQAEQEYLKKEAERSAEETKEREEANANHLDRMDQTLMEIWYLLDSWDNSGFGINSYEAKEGYTR